MRIALLMMILLTLISCGPAPAINSQPTATPEPTDTPQPTATPAPTDTPPPPTTSPLPTPAPQTASRPASPLPTPAADLHFEGEKAYQYVLDQVAIGPRPTGSEAGWQTGDFILAELEKLGWPTESQEFSFEGVTGRNITGKRGSGPPILIGAHYDTRPAADMDPDPANFDTWIDGANDGGSGVAVLLELARVLEPETLNHEIWLVFFDAEDRGRLDGWPFSVGAHYMAAHLTDIPQSVIIVDMIGDADQNLYFERNSDAALSREIWAVAADLGYEGYFIPEPKHTIVDDHLPFVQQGIPAVDIIDFDYAYWHTVEDTADKVAPASLERVGRTLERWLQQQ